MATIQDSLITDLILNGVPEYQSGMNQSASATQKLEQNQRALINASIALQTPIVALGVVALSVSKSMLKMADDFQQLDIGFKTLFKNMGQGSGAAKEFNDSLKQFAATTPFTYIQTAKLSKQLMAYKIEARDTVPMMRTLGDAVTALGGGEDALNRLVRAMGQINAKGKMTGEEVRQLSEVGIPAMQILADKLGLSAAEVGAVGRAGISSDKAIKALMEGMNEAFGGGMDARMETLSGQVSNLQDNFNYLTADLGNQLLPSFVSLTKEAALLTSYLMGLPSGAKAFIAWAVVLTSVGAVVKSLSLAWHGYNAVLTISKTLTEMQEQAALGTAVAVATETAAVNANTAATIANNNAKTHRYQTGTFLGQPTFSEMSLTYQRTAEDIAEDEYRSLSGSRPPLHPDIMNTGPIQGPRQNYSNMTRGGGGGGYGFPNLNTPIGVPKVPVAVSKAGGALLNAGKLAVGALGGPGGLAIAAVVGGIAWGAKAIADRKIMIDEFSKAAEDGVFKESAFSKAVVRDFEANKDKIGKAVAGALSESLNTMGKNIEIDRSQIVAEQIMNPPKTPVEAAQDAADLSDKDFQKASNDYTKAEERLHQAWVNKQKSNFNYNIDEVNAIEKEYQAARKNRDQKKQILKNVTEDSDEAQNNLLKLQNEEAKKNEEWAKNNAGGYNAAANQVKDLESQISAAELGTERADIIGDKTAKYNSLKAEAEAGRKLVFSLREQAKYTNDTEEQTKLLDQAMQAETEAMKDEAAWAEMDTEAIKEQEKAKEKLLDQQKELSRQRVSDKQSETNYIEAFFGEKSPQADTAKSSLRQVLEAESQQALSLGETSRAYDLATEATNLYRNSVDSLYGSLKRATEVGNEYTSYLKSIGMEKEADKYTKNVLSAEYAGLAQDAFSRGDQSQGYQLAAQAETAARAGGRKKKGQLTNALGGLGTGAPKINTNNQEFADKFGGLMDPYAARGETINNQLKQNQTIVNITNVFSAGTEYQKAESIRIQNDTNEANYYNNFTF